MHFSDLWRVQRQYLRQQVCSRRGVYDFQAYSGNIYIAFQLIGLHGPTTEKEKLKRKSGDDVDERRRMTRKILGQQISLSFSE